MYTESSAWAVVVARVGKQQSVCSLSRGIHFFRSRADPRPQWRRHNSRQLQSVFAVQIFSRMRDAVFHACVHRDCVPLTKS